MRRIDFLIKEAKESTNTTDISAISDSICVAYLNRIQSYIRDFLFNKNIESRILKREAQFNLVSGADTYKMPYDIYAKNAINNVSVVFTTGNTKVYRKIPQISEQRRGIDTGYIMSDDKIVFSPTPSSPLLINISYARKLPDMSLRHGKVLSKTSNSITLDTGYTPDIDDLTDYVSFVDKDGVVKACAISVDSMAGAVISTSSDTTDIAAGQYIVIGNYATTHSQLPDECEKVLIQALETFIFYRQSSKDIEIGTIINEKVLQNVMDVFANNRGDIFVPPVQEFSEWV